MYIHSNRAVQDAYPDVFRFTTSLFPSEDDDVVTSPYNAMLALSELVNHASAVLPISNQALLDIVATVDAKMNSNASRGAAVNLTGAGVPSILFVCTGQPEQPEGPRIGHPNASASMHAQAWSTWVAHGAFVPCRKEAIRPHELAGGERAPQPH